MVNEHTEFMSIDDDDDDDDRYNFICAISHFYTFIIFIRKIYGAINCI